ncbi:unnamed protein product [Gongylonema pulchrum]|uniref:Secreted protein n=1 Tax=Gongylonema pulchrum TaxID=637853 RepID=A0A183EJ41_9BILA|nr:unnamed protein product [Gongylonema pulchrum]
MLLTVGLFYSLVDGVREEEMTTWTVFKESDIRKTSTHYKHEALKKGGPGEVVSDVANISEVPVKLDLHSATMFDEFGGLLKKLENTF